MESLTQANLQGKIATRQREFLGFQSLSSAVAVHMKKGQSNVHMMAGDVQFLSQPTLHNSWGKKQQEESSFQHKGPC